ncbi:lysylphosphatidylglycerol synthase transmembrane domain-containing protein [Penaeicola halotolerans]|uniref:lysylphosphatidylglycerol synthase transmembrane domain-containing protein n=1 Tax=Penaeicola halotolerans TaxID=2793196 RepID=UPI001CF80018|nr:lysylphosphatidylglycerol synthase transmembrane domain-containing protein [Penaeicola halotolerans]
MDKRLKTILKTIVKLTLTVLALWLVFSKIDTRETKNLLFAVDWFYLFLAIIFFTLSKIAAALRLWHYFKAIGLQLSHYYNLKLYWIGMFYNLFLPGGIGGDGYKVYILQKQFQIGTKNLIKASLLDRINGVVSLGFLACGLILLLPINELIVPYRWIFWIGLIVAFPIFYLLHLGLFKKFREVFVPTNLWALTVQVLQLVCAYFLLNSLGVSENLIAYMALFLISSVVAVLPFTIGGVGARELVFVLGHQWFGIEQNTAVAFSLLFFLVTALVSILGAVTKVRID